MTDACPSSQHRPRRPGPKAPPRSADPVSGDRLFRFGTRLSEATDRLAPCDARSADQVARPSPRARPVETAIKAMPLLPEPA